jgi:two-component system, chemotaxis family, protein-glutamate methylesterase/glutaminase
MTSDHDSEVMDPRARELVVNRAVGIVGATGALDAVRTILTELPRDFRAPLLVVVSLPSDYVDPWATRLASNTKLAVTAAKEGQVLESGKVYLSGFEPRLFIEKGRLCFVQREPGVHDTMDFLLSSMARELGPGAVAVVLSGMGDDGAKGVKRIRDAGGYTIAQDRATSLIYAKAQFAVRLDAVCESLPLEGIAPRLVELVTTPATRPT